MNPNVCHNNCASYSDTCFHLNQPAGSAGPSESTAMAWLLKRSTFIMSRGLDSVLYLTLSFQFSLHGGWAPHLQSLANTEQPKRRAQREKLCSVPKIKRAFNSASRLSKM